MKWAAERDALLADNRELVEALKATKMWLQKLRPALNPIAGECLDDIIKDQIDAALSRARGEE